MLPRRVATLRQAPVGRTPPRACARRSLSGRSPSSSSPSRVRLPFRDARSTLDELYEQRRWLPMHRPELLSIFAQPFQQGRQADPVRVEHRPTSITWKAVTGSPPDIDVRSSPRDPFFENAKALIQQRIQTALHDLLLVIRTLLAAPLIRPAPADSQP